MLYSFDVFDTCLSRRCLDPKDVFLILAKKILLRCCRDEVTSEKIYQLASERQSVEKRVRESSTAEDIELHQIYKGFFELENWGIDPQLMEQEELLVEKELILPINRILKYVNSIRNEREKVIFVSDMYLPQSFIHEVLIEYGFATKETSVYSSGTLGVTKYSGNLFKIVCDRENVSPKDIVHFGDNSYSDVKVPYSLGIKSSLIDDIVPTKYENITADGKLAPSTRLQQSRIGGICRASRLQAEISSESEGIFEGTVCGGMAPLLVGFTAWVLRSALERNIDRLYFVARDGQVLLQIAKKLSKYIKTPEISYLHGSRQAWFLPSVTSPEDLREWISPPLHSTTPRNIMARVNMAPEDYEKSLGEAGVHLNQYDRPLLGPKLDEFIEFLCSGDLIEQIMTLALSTRKNVVAYLKQEGLFSTDKWAMVDLGWTLKTQRAIRKILIESGGKKEVQGFYLGVRHDHASVLETGDFSAYFLEGRDELYDKKVSDSIFSNVNLIEQILAKADHGMTIGYSVKNGLVVPDCKEAPTAEELKAIYEVRAGVLRFAEEYGRAKDIHNCESLLKAYSLENFKHLISNPQKEFVEKIKILYVGDDQNEARKIPLVKMLNILDWLKYLKFRILRFYDHQSLSSFEWMAGSLAISPLYIQYLFKPTLYVENQLRPLVFRFTRYVSKKRNAVTQK